MNLHTRKVWMAAVIGLCLCLLAGPASAFELKMDGTFTWNYQTFAQTGKSGFFGAYDVAAIDGVTGFPAGTFAPYNFWAGWHRRAGIQSGSDAGWQTLWMDTNVDLQINPALRVRGRYHVGEWGPGSAVAGQPVATGDLGQGDLVASEYLTYRYTGIRRSFSPGYWNWLFMTAQVPWGIVNFGRRPSAFGTGLGWNADVRNSETLSVSALYGPFNITVGVYPSRRGATARPSTTAAGLPAFNNTSGYYNVDRDKDNTRYDVGSLFTYRAGSIEMGALVNWVNFHTGGEGVLDDPVARANKTPGARAYIYLDNHTEWYGSGYAKFNNGRFFFNGEVVWFHQTEKTRGGLPANGIIGRGRQNGVAVDVRDLYIEHWRYALEAGVLAGPSKMSLLYAWLSGGDRRGMGGLIGQIDRTGILRSNSFANTPFFRPYSYLINEVYGTGVFQNGDTTDGYIEDAIIYAGRWDYALAANLNTFASFMWADRASKSGFGWGCIRPDTTAPAAGALPGTVNFGAITNANILNVWNNLSTPNIPDMNIGYEIDAGMDWKLIEGLVMKLTVAYWQPGAWFKWACRDKNIPLWGTNAPLVWPAGGTPATAFINPNRTIDPVWGAEVKFEGSF
ncbi:MAG: hypothetical protein HY914_16605 [Desulfomonile tiedjei]|nr:hypothetical protein [Desulfomonile tiedjei]